MFSATPVSARDQLILGLALAAGTAVLTYRLGWQGYWWDEHVTLMFTRLSWRELFITHWGLDTHRPVYYALQKAWVALFGESRAMVRSLPVVLTLPLIPIFFLAARHIQAGVMAPITAILMASAPMFLEQGRELRMYSLMNLGLALTLLLALTLAARARAEAAGEASNGLRTHWLWAGIGASMAIAFYAQALVVLVALLFAFWVLICIALGHLPRRYMLHLVWTVGLFLVLVAPAIPPFWMHLSGTLGSTFWVPEPSFDYIYGQTAAAYPYPKWTKPLVGLLLLWGIWRLHSNPSAAWLVGLMVIGLPVLVLGISFYKPIYISRVIAWGSIVSVLALAAGLAALASPWRWIGVAAVCCAQLSAAYTFYPKSPAPEEGRVIAEALATFKPGEDVLIIRDAVIEAEMTWYGAKDLRAPDVYQIIDTADQMRIIDRAYLSTQVDPSDMAQIPVQKRRVFVIATSNMANDTEPAMALGTILDGHSKTQLIITPRLALYLYLPG